MNLLAITQFEDIALESAFGILVVFSVLTISVLVFTLTGKISKKALKLKKKKAAIEAAEAISEEDEKELTGEEIAALSMALHQIMTDIHDEESNVITIKRIERRYTPWNSKIYGMTNLIR